MSFALRSIVWSLAWLCMIVQDSAMAQPTPVVQRSLKEAAVIFEKDGDYQKLNDSLNAIIPRRGRDLALSLDEMMEVWKSTRNDVLLRRMAGHLVMVMISVVDANERANEAEAFQRVLSFLESNPPSPASPVDSKATDAALMGISLTAYTGAQPTARGLELIYLHATRGKSDLESDSLQSLARLRPLPQRAKEILLQKLQSNLGNREGLALAGSIALRPVSAELRESVTSVLSHHIFNGKAEVPKQALGTVLYMSRQDPVAMLPLLRQLKERGPLPASQGLEIEQRIGEIEHAERLRTGSVNEASKSGLPIVIQAPPSEDSPGVDSHVVFGMFFRHHHSLTEQTGQLALARPAEAPKLTEGLARLLRIREDEQAKVALISKAAISDLDRIGKAARTYAETLRPGAQPLNDPVGRQFALERAQVLNRAIGELRSQLSEGSWKGLQSYINDELRLQIVKVKAQRTNAPVIVVPPKAR